MKPSQCREGARKCIQRQVLSSFIQVSVSLLHLINPVSVILYFIFFNSTMPFPEMMKTLWASAKCLASSFVLWLSLSLSVSLLCLWLWLNLPLSCLAAPFPPHGVNKKVFPSGRASFSSIPINWFFSSKEIRNLFTGVIFSSSFIQRGLVMFRSPTFYHWLVGCSSWLAASEAKLSWLEIWQPKPYPRPESESR